MASETKRLNELKIAFQEYLDRYALLMDEQISTPEHRKELRVLYFKLRLLEILLENP